MVKEKNIHGVQEEHWGQWLLPQVQIKMLSLLFRPINWLGMLPTRWYRLFRHLGTAFGWHWNTPNNGDLLPNSQNKLHRFFCWWLSLLIYLLEIIGIGELYETVTDFLKFNSRQLNPAELTKAQSIFGEQLNYGRIRLDQYAYLGPKQHHFCYVSFYLVNSWGKPSSATFIHELVHIWQYEQMGAIYMAKALLAQHSVMGYNYGGVEMLRKILNQQGSIHDFNLEQQADIVADLFRLRNNRPVTWGKATPADLPVYETIWTSRH